MNPKKHPPLTDDSPMPWGKHKGTPMKDVPDEYLIWVYKQVTEKNQWQYRGVVMAYIYKKLPELQANYSINTKKNFDFKKFIKK